MEASALQAPPVVTRGRASIGLPLLRLRSDEQLVELFRAGHEDAFRAIHDRYRVRLFAYARQMLPGARQDAEEVLQDVFVKAYSGLRASDREFALRAWLYRVAHNRCIDQLRRQVPVATAAVEGLCESTLYDPIVAAEQRETLRRLIVDVQRLPEQQRSALLLRELSGMSYAELSAALSLSVPAVKSLLVRARVSLAAALEARDTRCEEIRSKLVDCHDRGVRPNAVARRHLHDCAGCRDFRKSVRGISRSFAALTPGVGPLALLAKLGVSAGGGAAGGGSAASSSAVAAGGGAAAAAGGGAVAASGVAGTGGAVASGFMATTAGHVAAVFAAAVVAAGGAAAVEPALAPSHHRAIGVHRLHEATAAGIAAASSAAVIAVTVPAEGFAPAAVQPVQSAVRNADAPAATRTPRPARRHALRGPATGGAGLVGRPGTEAGAGGLPDGAGPGSDASTSDLYGAGEAEPSNTASAAVVSTATTPFTPAEGSTGAAGAAGVSDAATLGAPSAASQPASGATAGSTAVGSSSTTGATTSTSSAGSASTPSTSSNPGSSTAGEATAGTAGSSSSTAGSSDSGSTAGSSAGAGSTGATASGSAGSSSSSTTGTGSSSGSQTSGSGAGTSGGPSDPSDPSASSASGASVSDGSSSDTGTTGGTGASGSSSVGTTGS